jgi:hypothetical protein
VELTMPRSLTTLRTLSRSPISSFSDPSNPSATRRAGSTPHPLCR